MLNDEGRPEAAHETPAKKSGSILLAGNPDAAVLDDATVWFLDGLDALGIPLFVAPPHPVPESSPRSEGDVVDENDMPPSSRGRDAGEFRRPSEWPALTAAGNAARLAAWRVGYAICAVMGGLLAVVDVDPRNGGDVARVEVLLAELGVRIFARIKTPGGGVHFFVGGHPDLPLSKNFVGYNGIDIVSFGGNVFLPGTQRPKYAGRGYTVAVDDLEAFADGGDPDGAEALAAWVADHRPAKASDLPAAPPWDGKPPDQRQRAYMAGALTKICAAVAATAAGGRNHALYTAGLKCGSLIAGAGMDEQEVMAGLIEAAERNGYIADDGLAAARASIRSGLRNGKSNPRAVPEPRPDITFDSGASEEVPAQEGPAAVEPKTVAQAHAVYLRWLGPEYDFIVLDTVLCVVAAEKLTGDPAWLMIVGGSGAAKTETIAPLSGAGAVVTSTITSEGALLSATAKKERTTGATGGLLRKLGDHGVLVIKDVTSILSMNRDARATVLAALREVYDGFWERNVGSDGGQSLAWRGRLAVIGAVTSKWDKAHEVIAAMGDRFVIVRVDSTAGRIAAGRQAITNTGDEERMREDLADAVGGVIATVDVTVNLDLTQAEHEKVLALANVVTLARTPVEHDNQGNVVDSYAPEMPTRFAKQLTQIMRGGLALGMDREYLMSIVTRCAHDSVLPLRISILLDVFANADSVLIDVQQRLDKPRTTVERALQDLHVLGLLSYSAIHGALTDKSGWRYTVAAGIDQAVLADLRQVAGGVA